MMMAYTGGRGAKYTQIRKEQIVVTTGELIPELSGISAPVFGADGAFMGVMNLSIPTYRLDTGHAKHVRAAAEQLTGLFGGVFPPPEGD
jgi:DNA-binding IclR family transcriptional regulator